VEAARRLGYAFEGRSRTHITLRMHGEQVRLARSLKSLSPPVRFA